jgi:hypothetical protein
MDAQPNPNVGRLVTRPPAPELTPAESALVDCLRLLYRRGRQARELAQQSTQPVKPSGSANVDCREAAKAL